MTFNTFFANDFFGGLNGSTSGGNDYFSGMNVESPTLTGNSSSGSSDDLFPDSSYQVEPPSSSRDFLDLKHKDQIQIINDAVFSLIDSHLPNLVARKAIFLGDKSEFSDIVKQIDSFGALPAGSSSMAQAVKSWMGSYELMLADTAQILSVLSKSSQDGKRKGLERTIWHECLHFLEYEFPEIDALFKSKYGRHRNFEERHGQYYDDCVLDLWALENDIKNLGKAKSSTLSGTKTRFDRSYRQFWSTWTKSDYKADLRAFYFRTGVLIQWDTIENKLISGQQQGQPTASYTIGVKHSQSECWYIKGVTDRSQTSNVQVSPFTYERRVQGTMIYMTKQHFDGLTEFSDDELCIVRSYRM